MRTRFGFNVEKGILKKSEKIAKKVLDYDFSELTDDEIREKHNHYLTTPFEKINVSEAFALFGEVTSRVVGMKPYEVQYIGAYTLFTGAVAEMKTGEGKTLVALIASYLSVIKNQKVHVVTVNDYLAKRDCDFAKTVFDFLNVNTSYLSEDSSDHAGKIESYNNASIVYSSNTTLGFDYLRSNIVKNWDDKIINDVEECFAIIDEVDSILIDEAKTPLIISGEADAVDHDVFKAIYSIAEEMDGAVVNKEEDSTGNQTAMDKMMVGLNEKYADKDYVSDKKNKKTFLTEKGYQTLETKMLEYALIENSDELYKDNSKIHLVKTLESCISAINVYVKGVDYIVGKNKEGKDVVKLIDGGTGRVMEGRMLSNGMHQAIEMKEGVEISTESKTIAEIAYQNFFKLYDKISGMTGTAYEDRKEIETVYGLAVCQIPTRKPVIRIDEEDVIFISKEKKIEHTIKKIEEIHKTGQPILVGTNSVNDSEEISEILQKKGLKCNALNAKHHERESEIIAEAGKFGAITISTSMAGRGTDILLGGSLSHALEGKSEEEAEGIKARHAVERQKVLDAGGLYVLGFERNTSRRVDDQLKGRAGRQGDPGISRFYISLDDYLLQIFGADKKMKSMSHLIFNDSDYVTGSNMLSNVIKKAQKRASNQDSDARASLLKFDSVIDQQRRIFYMLRDQILQMKPDHIDIETGRYISDMIPDLEKEINGNLSPICDRYANEFHYYSTKEEEDNFVKELIDESLGIELDMSLLEKNLEEMNDNKAKALFYTVLEQINERKDNMSNFVFYYRLKSEKLHAMDSSWVELLEYSGDVKKFVQLRGLAQKKPEDEYKKETWERFNGNIIKSSTFDALKAVI